ncbi:MAG: biotin/lipoyl-containing protein [Pseudomonadota bacterium]
MAFKFKLNGQEHVLGIKARRPELVATIDDKSYQVAEAGDLGDGGSLILNVDGQAYGVWRVATEHGIHLKVGGRSFFVEHEDEITAAQLDSGAGDIVRADMPGVVVSVIAAPATPVTAGQAVMVIESMKMQITIAAPRDGQIGEIHVSQNDTFDKGDDLITMRPLED